MYPQCIVCGQTEHVIQHTCCMYWFCSAYPADPLGIMIKYEGNWKQSPTFWSEWAYNSCYRYHMDYTLCAHHSNYGHEGHWQTCQQCRIDYDPEVYASYGSNEYNVVKLQAIPRYHPTKCIQCKKDIAFAGGHYSIEQNRYFCSQCTNLETVNELTLKIATINSREKYSSHVVWNYYLDNQRLELIKRILEPAIPNTGALGRLHRTPVFHESKCPKKDSGEYLGIKYSYGTGLLMD